MNKRGFTLVELAFVLATLTVLITLAVPVYQTVTSRAKSDEARMTLAAINHAEQMYRRDHGKYRACAPSADHVPAGVAGSFDAHGDGWSEIGMNLEGVVRYRYRVELEGDANFRAIAEGDLDGDGTLSKFTLSSSDLEIRVENELE